MNLSKQHKIIIGLIIVIVVAILVLLLINNTKFRITKSTPDTNNYPSTLGVLILEFSEDLDKEFISNNYNKDASNVVKFSFDSPAYIEIDKNKLIITIQETALKGKYSLNLNNIRSKDGNNFSANIPFIIKDIPYDAMSDEAKKIFDEYSTEGETLPENPIVSLLPHDTDNYKITYIFPEEDVEMPATITITMKFFEPGDEALPATPAEKQEYLNNIRKYRTEALDYLKTNGIDINNYVLEYTEVDLRDEFPSGYQPQPEF